MTPKPTPRDVLSGWFIGAGHSRSQADDMAANLDGYLHRADFCIVPCEDVEEAVRYIVRRGIGGDMKERVLSRLRSHLPSSGSGSDGEASHG